MKDDWDDDEDSEEEAPTVEKNKEIWEDACVFLTHSMTLFLNSSDLNRNTKVHHPMPEVILARNTAAPTPSAHIPPQGVFDQLPKMKILKRPTQSTPSPVPTLTENSQESLKEREARYKAARERIFGSESPAISSSSITSPKSLNPPQQQVKVAREPRGPSNASNAFGARGGTGGHSKGFQNRSVKPREADDTQ